MITVDGEIVVASWSIALYQNGRQHALASHRDFECTQVLNAWSLDPRVVPTVKAELESTQSDRTVEWPTVQRIMRGE